MAIFWENLPSRLTECSLFFVCLFGLRLYVPVNNFSVMSGRSHRFLGITSTFWEVNVSCSGGKCNLLKDVYSLCIMSICIFTFSYIWIIAYFLLLM